MFLFSGTFFPLDNLPAWARELALIFPLTHLVRLTRYFCLGVLRVDLLWGAAYLAAFSMVCFPLALFAMRRRLIH
jgi:lipooligosaccharide transport system permease protein